MDARSAAQDEAFALWIAARPAVARRDCPQTQGIASPRHDP